MPSSTSLEDLLAEIYAAGVKDPRKLNMIKRLITAYSWGVARKTEALEDVAPSFTELSPGEWSMALEVTCCAGPCQQVKRWEFYHADGRHATGHKVICKDCRAKEYEELGKAPYVPEKIRRGGWRCSACGERRIPSEFPEEKRRHPRKSAACLFCQDESGNDDK